MFWFAILCGTGVLSAMGLVLLVLIARRESNRTSSVPLVLRTFLAVVTFAWGFIVGGGPNGVGFAVLPSTYLLKGLLSDTRASSINFACATDLERGTGCHLYLSSWLRVAVTT